MILYLESLFWPILSLIPWHDKVKFACMFGLYCRIPHRIFFLEAEVQNGHLTALK
jgi:hypothetical protein